MNISIEAKAGAWTAETLEALASAPAVSVEFAPGVRARIAASAERQRRLELEGVGIYGVTTGFGPLVAHAAHPDGRRQGAGLLAHLGVGAGPVAPVGVVRATVLLRLAALAGGRSGISPEALQAYAQLLAAEGAPAVPEVGSLGASGDLIPLAQITRRLCGEGEWLRGDATLSAREVLRELGVTPPDLSARDALALVNGVSFSAARTALALARAARLLVRAEQCCGLLYRVLGARPEALDARLHEARGYAGNVASAAAIRESAGPYAPGSRPFQEIYSIRCAPQILGACRDQLAAARAMLESGLGGADDNPLCFTGEDGAPQLLHGGNFYGQHIAFAADAINAVLAQITLLAERQLDALLNPAQTGATPMLARAPGGESGLAGLQLTATALAAEARSRAMFHSLQSIPTNGGNQDIVPMAALAARAAYEQTERAAGTLGALAIAILQLDDLQAAGRAGSAPRARCIDAAAEDLPEFIPLAGDRALDQDLARFTQALLEPRETQVVYSALSFT